MRLHGFGRRASSINRAWARGILATKPLPGLQKAIALDHSFAIPLCNMLIGYARVSTNEQDTATQVGALNPQDASGSFARKLPAAVGIGLNCIDFLTSFERRMSL